jgi:hypothetical protein
MKETADLIFKPFRLAQAAGLCGWLIAGVVFAGEPLPIYRPQVEHAPIYFYHPKAKPLLSYNHDVDIVKFKGRYFAAWNANEASGEYEPGQFNYLSVSDDFKQWSPPVQPFSREAGADNPVETDNQWQPNFINWRDETLFCAWCDYEHRKTYVSTSADGLRWRNREVSTGPPSLADKVVAFPTNHGLITSKGVMMFPCSLPRFEERLRPYRTRYAGVLLNEDGGKTWTWSEPIQALPWSKIGDKPEEVKDDLVAIWEPMLFELDDGKIGLLIRNCTGPGKPHQMLLYATSSDHGQTWTRARAVEVDTLTSRNYAVSGAGTRDSLLMVMNDNYPQKPRSRPQDRYFLSLYFSPVCDPDLLLPGPIVQPEGGRAYYPNGFVEDGKLYVAYTYPRGIHGSIIEPLPDFTRAFLLLRGGRAGLKIENRIARFGQKQSSLGLVLTEELTRQATLRLAFDVSIGHYDGTEWPVLTLGGKTRKGSVLRAIYHEEKKTDFFQVRLPDNPWADIAPFEMQSWNHVEVELTRTSFSVSINQSPAKSFPIPVLRKICFGGLYAAPAWPMGLQANRAISDVRLKLDSIVIE